MSTTKKTAVTSIVLSTLFIVALYFGMEYIWTGFWNNLWWVLALVWFIAIGVLNTALRSEEHNDLINSDI